MKEEVKTKKEWVYMQLLLPKGSKEILLAKFKESGTPMNQMILKAIKAQYNLR